MKFIHIYISCCDTNTIFAYNLCVITLNLSSQSTLSELRECKEKHEVEVVKLTECVMLKDRWLHDITSQTEESLSTLRNSLDTLKKENEELRGKADR